MKKLLSIFFIFVFSLATFAQAGSPTKSVEDIKQQTKKFKNKNRYVALYDKFEDSTIVQCVGFNLISNVAGALSIIAADRTGAQPTMVFLGAGFTFSGDTLKETPDDYFILFNYSGEQWKFLKSSKLIALVDGGERVQFGDGVAVRDIERGGSVNEKIGFKISHEQLQKFASAKTVEIKIGTFVKKLDSEYMEMFGNVLKLGDVTQKAESKKSK